jgi:O-antigen ligase
LITATDSAALRQLYWIVHRVLPPTILVMIVVGSALGITHRRLGRLGRADALAGLFVLAGLLSIAMQSNEPAAQVILFADRWIAPICLYLSVRLLQPSLRDLRWLPPVALGILLVEAPLAIATLTIPGALPNEWIVLTRATGSFGDPDVLGTTMAFCGMVLLWAGTTTRRPVLRVGSVVLFVLAMLIVFLTFSRANWVAGLLVVAACAWIFRDRLASLALAVPLVLAVLLMTGVLAGPLAFAQERLASQRSQESALSRLPVAVAAVRMFGERPVTGWGYGNFDRYSRSYQGSVGNLITADKSHASHNLFLTIAAEQGAVGLLLFFGPMVVWLARTFRVHRRMPLHAMRFVAGLWLIVAAFVVVNNFSVMKSPFGLGMWWLSLALIGTTVDRYVTPEPPHLPMLASVVGSVERRGGSDG